MLVYGNGENVRDWLYVYDYCIVIDLIIYKGNIGEIYNIGGYNERSNLEVVKVILNFLGKFEELIFYVNDRFGYDLRYVIDVIKIENELGWKVKYDFDLGIKEIVKWYIENEFWWKVVLLV